MDSGTDGVMALGMEPTLIARSAERRRPID
jgi:hypothetical protein